MFNAEKLLGRIVKETLGGRSSQNTKSRGLFDSLASGQGLMTIVGLGVGAFEILKEQKGKSSSGSLSAGTPPSIPANSKPPASPPPPLPEEKQHRPPIPPVPAVNEERAVSNEDLALRLIRVMIAAAHADGSLDEAEEKAKLDSEEKMFLIQELHQPKSLAELTNGIVDPAMAQTMYMLATATIEIDTEAERNWLDELGDQLGITSELRTFIEEQS